MPGISRPGDAAERQAEVAEHAMATVEGSRMPSATAGVVAADGGSPAAPRGAGRSFTPDERERLPVPALDVGRVRIHDDSEAATLADAFDARAYAWGPRIVVGARVPRPIPTPVLAHELRHVAQWRPDAGVVMRLPLEPTGVPFEAEVFPHWSTPLRTRPGHDAHRLADLPRHQRVTVEGGRGWLRVSTVVNGVAMSGFVSHEQLRAVAGPEPVPAEPVPPPGPVDEKQPLPGTTSEASGLNVRSEPGADGPVIGKLSYRAMKVQVLDSRIVTDKLGRLLWLKVRFSPEDFQAIVLAHSMQGFIEGQGASPATDSSAQPAVPGSPEGWVSEAGLSTTAMKWADFLGLVRAFDAAYAEEPVTDRLSRLRQIGEEPDVPGNAIVGAGGGLTNQTNRGDQKPDPSRWSLLYEAKQVELPSGEIVDIHHMLLGAESLIDDGRRSEDRFTPLGSVGQSYAATTWSGDIGGAAADLVWHKSADWEQRWPAPSPEEIDSFYFRTRASDQDLLGDIDAWGAYETLPAPGEKRPLVTSIAQFLTFTYGSGESGPGLGEFVLSNGRARGIANLLRHYGFTAATGLRAQTDAVNKMDEQALIFTEAWSRKNYGEGVKKVLKGKPPPAPANDQDLVEASHRMTLLFIDWLENQAKRYSVDLTEGGSTP
jgi:Domain of unknown function (DUF4157)/Bacterial SH3 domain